ncbi:hypothetical protein GCM10020220_093540 [Nonomuraea rubra]
MDDVELLLGGGAGVDAGLAVVEGCGFAAVDDRVAVGDDAQLGGDGAGGAGVVAGDEDGPDAGAFAVGDGGGGGRAWRVQDRDQAEQ